MNNAYKVALPEVREEINFWMQLDREDEDSYTLEDAIVDACDHFSNADGVSKKIKDNIKDVEIAAGVYRPQTDAESKMQCIVSSRSGTNYNAKNWDMQHKGVKYMLVK
jgi:hypothetical protein